MFLFSAQLFLQREMAARQMEEAPDTPSKGDSSPNKSGEWRESDSGIEWIAKSAEKVKAAEEQRKEAAKESTGESSKDEGDSAEKSIDGASILEDEETFTKGVEKKCLHLGNFCAFREGGRGGGWGENYAFREMVGAKLYIQTDGMGTKLCIQMAGVKTLHLD